jgi:alpha-1,2-mannosyltransferase
MLKRFYADEDLLRVPHIALLLLGVSLIIGGIYAGYNSPLGLYSQPMGMDFYCFWSAGRLAIEGHVLDIFDPKVLATFQQSTLGAPEGWSLPWFYPPLLLLFISAGFALLPYKLAYFAYLLISISAYYVLTRRFFPTLKPLHILSFPAFWFNLLSGQNGLLTAVILIGGLLSLSRQPMTAGIILAALSFKPQLCLALPVFLIAERRWTTIIAGILTFLALTLAATLAWGPTVWSAFIGGLQAAQDFNQLANKIRPESLAHLYGTLKTIGVAHQPAMIANYVFAAVAFAVGLRIFLRTDDQAIKNSVVILATLLLPPHLMYYDFVVTGAVIAWLWPRENLRTALVILWWAPLMWPVVAKWGIPQLPLATALLFYQLHKETSAANPATSRPGVTLAAG